MEINITIKIDDEEIRKSLNTKAPGQRGPYPVSIYARFFDEDSRAWCCAPGRNLEFLIHTQHQANDMLKCNRRLFLNDVYSMLDIPKTTIGARVGWIYEENNPHGDNYVDFDIFSPRNRNFVNGYERSILLDFNVDGDISGR